MLEVILALLLCRSWLSKTHFTTSGELFFFQNCGYHHIYSIAKSQAYVVPI